MTMGTFWMLERANHRTRIVRAAAVAMLSAYCLLHSAY